MDPLPVIVVPNSGLAGPRCVTRRLFVAGFALYSAMVILHGAGESVRSKTSVGIA